jgi:endonuclease/exonuclease/phosphatase family metal-dependent hydrolase
VTSSCRARQDRGVTSGEEAADDADEHGPFGELITTTLRLVTWNLWWRFGPWEARQPAIAATLAELQPDLVGLQEVWSVGRTNQAALLAEQLGFHHAYATRFTGEDIQFGNAVLSRWPITAFEPRPLPAPPDQDEMRTVLRADIDGPRGPIELFTTHLHWRFDHGHIRQEQVRAITAFIQETAPRTYPALLCGDFNATPDADEIRMLTGRAAVPDPPLVFHDAWEVAGDGPGYTWSNQNPYAAKDLEPNRRIDYVFAGWPKAGGAGHVTSCRVVGTEPIDGVVPSDHYGLVAELRY